MKKIDDSWRVSGGILGLLVGDALGVPYEFKRPQELPGFREIEMIPPKHFKRSHSSVPPGTWSDDGAQALCLARTLLDNDNLDLEVLGNRLLQWFNHGYYAVDGIVFDCGTTTRAALDRLESGISPEKSGGQDENSNGNGSLMRVLPLALWHRGTHAELVELAHLQSVVTHGNPISRVCCALYCLIARELLQGAKDTKGIIERSEAFLIRHYDANSGFQSAFKTITNSAYRTSPQGSGYVVDSLWSALWAFDQGAYDQVVKKAVGLGHDTDTTACIAGGLAGIRDGAGAIPQHWLDCLRGSGWCDPIISSLRIRAMDAPFSDMELLPGSFPDSASSVASTDSIFPGKLIIAKIKSLINKM